MIVEIKDLNGDPVVGCSVFSTNEAGGPDNNIAVIADGNGVVYLPNSGPEYLTFSAVGKINVNYYLEEVPHMVIMEDDVNALAGVTITGSPTEAKPVNWLLIAGIIAGIAAIGAGFIYLRNNSIRTI